MQSRSASPPLSSAAASLIALAAGIALGSLIHQSPIQGLDTLAAIVEPIGTLWVRALQMVVIPLVVCNLIVAITAGRDSASVGRLGAASLVVFLVLLVLGAIYTLTVSPVLIEMIAVDPEMVASLRPTVPEAAAKAAEGAVETGGFGAWLVGIVPVNILEAMANGQFLQIIVFTLLFGMAINGISPERRQFLRGFFAAVADASFVIIHWLLRFTALAVFALALAFARQAGLGVGGVLVKFVLVFAVILTGAIVLLYIAAIFAGKVSPRDFARALFPAQTVAVSTRSSLAALPVVIDGARDTLKLPQETIGFVLPLSGTVFKVNRTISAPMKLLFIAHIYGVDLGPSEILTFVVTTVILSFSTLGLPSGGAPFKTLPVYMAAGVPVEGVVLLKAIDVIPDTFNTVANVTGFMTSSVLVTRLSGSRAVTESSPAK